VEEQLVKLAEWYGMLCRMYLIREFVEMAVLYRF
jgi:hypothetical protein